MVDVQWAFISIVASSIAHFILRIVIGKELGPEGLGVYTLVFTVYLFGMQFAAFGIGSALTKYVAEFIDDTTNIRNYVSSGMTSSIITGIFMGAILFFLAPFIAISFFKVPELVGLIQITSFSFPFIAIQKAVLGTLNGFRKMSIFTSLNIIQNFSIVIVSIVLVQAFNGGIIGAVIGFIGPTILVGIFSPILIRDSFGLNTSFWHMGALRATTVFGFYVVLGNSIGFLNTQIGCILIGHYLNTIEVGIYSVASLFAQTLTLIPSAVQRVTAPITSTMYCKGEIEGVRKVLASSMKKSFIISTGLAALIIIFGQYLILLLFSEEFLLAYTPLLILLVGYTIFAPLMAVGATLSSIGKVHIPFRISAICAILNIFLSILLIPQFGINGAAIATTVTLVVNFGLTMLIIKKYLGS